MAGDVELRDYFAGRDRPGGGYRPLKATAEHETPMWYAQDSLGLHRRTGLRHGPYR